MTGGTGSGAARTSSRRPPRTRQPTAAGAARRWEGTDFAGLSRGTAVALLQIASGASYDAGEIVLREGTSTPFLGLVRAGRIGLRLLVPERGPQTVVTIEPGEIVGWSAVVAPYRATAEAVALEPTRLDVLPAEAIRGLLVRDPLVAAEVLPVVLRSVSERLGTSWHQLLDLFAAGGHEPW